MADDDGQKTEEELRAEAEAKKKTRRRTTRKQTTQPRTTQRMDRRVSSIEETLLEVVRWLKLDWSSEGDLGFVDTVERDAQRIGTGLAAVGERIKTFGTILDAVFGLTGPIAIVVALGPTVRAAYREGREKMTERSQRRKLSLEQKRAVQEEEERFDDGEPLLEETIADRRAEWVGEHPAPGV